MVERKMPKPNIENIKPVIKGKIIKTLSANIIINPNS